MKRSSFLRLTAALLSLALTPPPAAQALTAGQCAQLLQMVYIDEVPQSVLDRPAIDDMLSALGDPYTQYFTAGEYAAFRGSLSDSSLVGIGVAFSSTQDGLLISRVLEDSPALRGGLRTGDLITAIDGRSVLGQDTQTLTDWIQGEVGTPVRITYLRNESQSSVTLVRARVVIRTTTAELLDGHIGYIICSAFGQETPGHFQEAMKTYGKDADVWIVDLRGNSGGLTTAATDAAGLFTGPGDMGYLRDGVNQYTVYRTDEPPATYAPAIILTDSRSASASELFASAVRDQGAGIVVGTRTFGKGVAQTVLDGEVLPNFFSAGDAIKITSHRFFSPRGNTPDQLGVLPDLPVPEPYIGGAAYLLSASSPGEEARNTLRLELNRPWYINLDLLSEQPEYRDALAALLCAMPLDAPLWRRTSAADWHRTSPQEAAEEFGLDYTAPLFPDQAESNDSAALSRMKSNGLIYGYDDGLFHPQESLTRAQFCELLALALNRGTANATNPYADVAEDAWYKSSVAAISGLGLMLGDGEGFFHPNDPIDHQQFITVMGRLGQRINRLLYDAALKMTSEDFSQEPSLVPYADWARPSVWLMSQGWRDSSASPVNLLWASPDEIAANQPTTRDEAVITLCRLLLRLGVLPQNGTASLDE